MNFKYFRTDNKLGKYLKIRLIEVQQNKCIICENKFKNSLDIKLDHNHNTGEIRGLLCNKCNSLLRKPNDNETSLLRIKNYLNNLELSLDYNNYKIKKEYKEKVLIIQNNCCKICENDFSFSKKICIDHNHRNGKIRGLLCDSCNISLTYPNDDIKIIDRAILYVNNNLLKEELNKLEIEMKIKKELLKIENRENRATKNLETRKKMSIKKKEYFSNPENRKKHGKIQLIRFSKPGEKEKCSRSGKKSHETRLKNINNKILLENKI